MNARTARQWMVTHEWMVKPMAQTEWIQGKGMLVWLAEVFSALGTGLYLVSLFFGLNERVRPHRLLGRPLRLDHDRGLQAAAAPGLPREALALLEELSPVQQRLADLLVRPGHRLHHDFPGLRGRPDSPSGPHRLQRDGQRRHLGRQPCPHGARGGLLRDDRRLLRLRHELLQERPLLEHGAPAHRVPAHGGGGRSGPRHGCGAGQRSRTSSGQPNRPPGSC